MIGITLEQTHAQFQTTCWTVVRSLGGADDQQRRRYLEGLIQRYWPPVYAYLRRNGCSRDLAAETTQAFFSDCVLQRRLFEKAAEGRGRLSSLILQALKNYRIDVHRASVSRGVDLRVPFDVERMEGWLSSSERGPEQVFEHAWDAEIWNEAFHHTQMHFEQHGKLNYWQLFEARVITPARTGQKAPGYAALAPELGFADEKRARLALGEVKQHLRTKLEAAKVHAAGRFAEPDTWQRAEQSQPADGT